MDREACTKSFWARFRKVGRKTDDASDDQPGRTDELVLRPVSVEGVRSAVDTADFLIVHDRDDTHDVAADDSPVHKTRVRALRERVDTGDYAVQFEMIAEAMVERVKRLQKGRSDKD